MLRWLSGHDRDQVRLLLGNHDTSRVMELIRLDDARFAAAQALARSLVAGTPTDRASARAAFARSFPDVPTPGLAARDYASYSEEQRGLVMGLLLAGRFGPGRRRGGGGRDRPHPHRRRDVARAGGALRAPRAGGRDVIAEGRPIAGVVA